MPFKTLPKAGNDLWEQAYAAGLKKFNGDKSRAARYAWGAVRNAGYVKLPSGKWVKKNTAEALITLAADLLVRSVNEAYDK